MEGKMIKYFSILFLCLQICISCNEAENYATHEYFQVQNRDSRLIGTWRNVDDEGDLLFIDYNLPSKSFDYYYTNKDYIYTVEILSNWAKYSSFVRRYKISLDTLRFSNKIQIDSYKNRNINSDPVFDSLDNVYVKVSD